MHREMSFQILLSQTKVGMHYYFSNCNWKVHSQSRHGPIHEIQISTSLQVLSTSKPIHNNLDELQGKNTCIGIGYMRWVIKDFTTVKLDTVRRISGSKMDEQCVNKSEIPVK